MIELGWGDLQEGLSKMGSSIWFRFRKARLVILKRIKENKN